MIMITEKNRRFLISFGSRHVIPKPEEMTREDKGHFASRHDLDSNDFSMLMNEIEKRTSANYPIKAGMVRNSSLRSADVIDMLKNHEEDNGYVMSLHSKHISHAINDPEFIAHFGIGGLVHNKNIKSEHIRSLFQNSDHRDSIARLAYGSGADRLARALRTDQDLAVDIVSHAYKIGIRPKSLIDFVDWKPENLDRITSIDPDIKFVSLSDANKKHLIRQNKIHHIGIYSFSRRHAEPGNEIGDALRQHGTPVQKDRMYDLDQELKYDQS